MVATRVVLAFDCLIVLFALGADWLVLGMSYSTIFDVYSVVGGYIGSQTAMTCVQSNLSPIVLGNLGLDFSMVAVPAAAALGLAAFSRWKLALPAGIGLVLGGVVWVEGILGISQAVSQNLATCPDLNGPPTVGPSLGPYIAMVAGALLIGTYFMTRLERLDPPMEGRPPTKTGQG